MKDLRTLVLLAGVLLATVPACSGNDKGEETSPPVDVPGPVGPDDKTPVAPDPEPPTPAPNPSPLVSFPGFWPCDPGGLQACPDDLQCLRGIPWSDASGSPVGFDVLGDAWETYIREAGGGLCARPCGSHLDCDQNRGEECRIFSYDEVPYSDWLANARASLQQTSFSSLILSYRGVAAAGKGLYWDGAPFAGLCVNTGSNDNLAQECLLCFDDSSCGEGVCLGSDGLSVVGGSLGACHSTCEDDAHCSMGFACDKSVESGVCRPTVEGAGCWTCIDRDGDGYGIGPGCGTSQVNTFKGFDCDDSDPRAHAIFGIGGDLRPPDEELCPPSRAMFQDLNCNGINDYDEMVGAQGAYPRVHCATCHDSCTPFDGGVCVEVGESSRCQKSCPPGFEDCDGDPSTGANGCETYLASVDNCGGCGLVCSNPHNAVSAACSSGAGDAQCGIGTCNAGFGDCDGASANGCEVSLMDDRENCGACGYDCAEENPGANVAQWSCTSGTCVRNTAVTLGGGPASAGCAKRIFGSSGNYADCNGDFGLADSDHCEVNLYNDTQNCGACGNVCGSGESCHAGACTQVCDTARFADCDGDLATGAQGCEASIVEQVYCGGCTNNMGTREVLSGDARGMLVGLKCNGASGPVTLEELLRAAGMTSPVCDGQIDRCSKSADGIFSCEGGLTVTCTADAYNAHARSFSCGADAPTFTDATAQSFAQWLSTSNEHCGACGNQCSNGAICEGGTCVLPEGACGNSHLDCDDVAANGCETPRDTANCIGCGISCPSGPNARVVGCAVTSDEDEAGRCIYICVDDALSDSLCGASSMQECLAAGGGAEENQCMPCALQCEAKTSVDANELWMCAGGECLCSPMPFGTVKQDFCDGRSASCELDSACPANWIPSGRFSEQGKIGANETMLTRLRPLLKTGGYQGPLNATDLFTNHRFTRSMRVTSIDGVERTAQRHPRILGLEVDRVSHYRWRACGGNGCRMGNLPGAPFAWYVLDKVADQPAEYISKGIPSNLVGILRDTRAMGREFGGSAKFIDSTPHSVTIGCDSVPYAAGNAGYQGVLVGIALRYDPLYPLAPVVVPGSVNACVQAAADNMPCGAQAQDCCVESNGTNCLDTPKDHVIGAVDYTELASGQGVLATNARNSSGCGAGFECRYRRPQADFCEEVPGTQLRPAGLSGIAPVCSYVRLGVKEGVTDPTSARDYELHLYADETNRVTFVGSGAGSLSESFSDISQTDKIVLQYPDPTEASNIAFAQAPGGKTSSDDDGVRFFRVSEVPRVNVMMIRFDDRNYPHVRLNDEDYTGLSTGENGRAQLRVVGQSLARGYVYQDLLLVTVVTGP